MRYPSASKLWLAEACAGGFALPWVRRDTPAATRGKVLHRFIEQVPLIGREAALDEVPAEHRQACALIDVDALPPGESEVALAYNYVSGAARIVGRGLGRRYGRLVDELPGAVDRLDVDRMDRGEPPALWDFKTGKVPPPAKDNLQLQMPALCVRRIYGVDEVDTAIVHILPSGQPVYDAVRYGLADWARIEARIRRIVGAVQRAIEKMLAGRYPDVNRGEHCRFCDGFAACPETAQLARMASRALEDPDLHALVTDGIWPQLSEEEAQRLEGFGWQLRNFAYALLDALRAGERSRPKYPGRAQLPVIGFGQNVTPSHSEEDEHAGPGDIA